jgi:enoyl-CoA hydratase
MSDRFVEVESQGVIGLVTLRREKALNALSSGLMAQFLEAVADMDSRPDVRAVIVTGAGDKAFAAGADIAEMQAMGEQAALGLSARGAEIGRAIERSRLVWIAAVNGFALGGGCELAMCCDFIYASTTAKFGQPEVKLGVIPGFGGTQRLARRVGIGKAKELIVTGDVIGAEEALRIGLADALFPPAELIAQARKTAEKIAANGPLAVAAAKRAIQDGWALPLDQALALEGDAFAGLFATADQREGMAAFLAKRPADFQGK